MEKSGRTVLVGSVALLMALAAGGTASAYTDVVTGLQTVGYDLPPELAFSWSAVFHQDTFVSSNLIESGGGPAYSAKPGGYLTVNRVLAHPDPENTNATDRVTLYGAGNVFEVNVGGHQPGSQLLPVDTRLKVVIGNLTFSRVELISAGDTEVQGTANAVDSLTGAAIQVPASRFVDSNNDGVLIYKTYFNTTVTPGNDKYYDYNRDGQIIDAALNKNAANHATSDRPFIAIYETKTGSPVDFTSPPSFNADHDASGSLTDNLWVGNPYAPVNADPAGSPRGADGENPAGTPEADPNITNVAGFNEPLLVGEIKSLYLLTVVNLSQYGRSNTFFVSNGEFDAEITDGRLYDWYAALFTSKGHAIPPYCAILNASLLFDLARNPLTKYEYFDDGTLILAGQPCPEPSALLLALGSAMGLVLRRRK